MSNIHVPGKAALIKEVVLIKGWSLRGVSLYLNNSYFQACFVMHATFFTACTLNALLLQEKVIKQTSNGQSVDVYPIVGRAALDTMLRCTMSYNDDTVQDAE